MHHDYRDIRSRIAEEPSWYDENGCPRYGAFEPSLASDIYADEVVLLEIGCQGCDEVWRVVVTSSVMDRLQWRPPLRVQIKTGRIHYGDPPNHVETDAAGSTMNCIDRRVLEYWYRGGAYGETWARNHELEIELPHE